MHEPEKVNSPIPGVNALIIYLIKKLPITEDR